MYKKGYDSLKPRAWGSFTIVYCLLNYKTILTIQAKIWQDKNFRLQ